MLEVAHDIAAIFSLPKSKIVHVRDRAFNDRRYYICDKRLAALGAQRHECFLQSARATGRRIGCEGGVADAVHVCWWWDSAVCLLSCHVSENWCVH